MKEGEKERLKELKEYLESLSKEEIIDIAVNLSQDAERLRNELSDLSQEAEKLRNELSDLI